MQINDQIYKALKDRIEDMPTRYGHPLKLLLTLNEQNNKAMAKKAEQEATATGEVVENGEEK